MAKPLCVIPSFVRAVADVAMLETCLRTLRETAGDACDVMVVDDGSPEQELTGATRELTERHGGEFIAQPTNEGFSATVNVGLRRALAEGRDAVLVNADIEFGLAEDWLELMVGQHGSDGSTLAPIVGALLLYPNGLIQHGGIFFSILFRAFDHIYRYGPGDLPEAQVPRVCPVTGALQFIRHGCLEEIGLYDESFRMGWEDVDYNVRAWQAGRESVYQPAIKALHHEGFFRGAQRPSQKVAKWQHESWLRFCAKHGNVSFAEFVPSLTLGEK